jgi:uncharacterized protein YecE (DUF72 family)
MAGKFFGGTSGLLIAIPKRDFAPEHADKSRLGFYALHENSIEINSSFYKLPQAKTIGRWLTEVTADFRFTFKLWKEVTHQKNLLFRAEDVRRFMDVISIPQINQGCLLIQFPPSLQVSALPQLAELLNIVNEFDWRVAVEFRHNSWYNDTVFELLSGYQMALVTQDMPKSATPIEITADDLVYLRFHGPGGSYKGSYSDDFLYEYALYIREWQQEGKMVYCYFNNTAGDALNNLHFLKNCLDGMD